MRLSCAKVEVIVEPRVTRPGLVIGSLLIATGVVALILPTIVAAAFVAALAALVSAGRWPWYVWLALSPAVYFCWLVVFLFVSAAICGWMGKRFPKPRYAARQASWLQRPSKDQMGLVTALVCYRRLAIVQALPFTLSLIQLYPFNKLILRSYSPSVHLGEGVTIMNFLYDPDLTELGDQVVVGGRAAIVAHGMAKRRDGGSTYVSVPVKIGNRATIGGQATIGMGCVIGEDAIVELGAVVAPFTHIPNGEVWAGNPASFRRKRGELDDVMRTPSDAPPVADALAAAAIATPAPRPNRAAGLPDQVDVRRLVIEALDLQPEQIPDILATDTCSAWDSLGQVAIAAALFDRYGVTVDPGRVFAIRTLRDITDVIAEALDAGPGAVPAELADADVLLPGDVEMLPLLDARDATRRLASQSDRKVPASEHVDVVIAASFTAQPIVPTLKLWGAVYGLELDCEFVGYDQIVQALLDDHSPFVSNKAGINLVLTRPEDLISASDVESAARVDELLKSVEAFASRQSTGHPLFVGTLPPVVSSFGFLDRSRSEGWRYRWRQRLELLEGVELFDFDTVVERLGVEEARCSRTEVLTRAPYSSRLYQELAIAVVRKIRSRRTSRAKVIALDCDNTLWGGVIGEVGFEGVDLSSDGPGRSYQLFQGYLKSLKERGLLLVVVSRNEEKEVREMFEHQPGMVLRPDDIAAWQVNWRYKSQNLRALSVELNLGLDSFVLLDDDPAVRAEVEARLPEVHVVPLPSDPAAYCDTLSRLWLFDSMTTTAVDLGRTQMVKEESHRQDERRSASSLEDFLARLQLRVEMSQPAEQDWPRVAQLTQRTNQFNLSLNRRTTETLRHLGAEATVLILKAEDRFGDYGLIGVCGSSIDRRGLRLRDGHFSHELPSSRTWSRGRVSPWRRDGRCAKRRFDDCCPLCRRASQRPDSGVLGSQRVQSHFLARLAPVASGIAPSAPTRRFPE